MTSADDYLRHMLLNLQALREKNELSVAQMEEQLILGPGWIGRFERAETIPNLDLLLAILHESGSSLADLIADVPGQPQPTGFTRGISAGQDGDDILIRFPYANFDAAYRLGNAKVGEFDSVVRTLRDGLSGLASVATDKAEAIKTDSGRTNIPKSSSSLARGEPF